MLAAQATSFPGFSPTRPTERERERETLVGAGHLAPEQNLKLNFKYNQVNFWRELNTIPYHT